MSRNKGGLKALSRAFSLAFSLALLPAGSALACSQAYTVAPGETVFSIAEAQLGHMRAWPMIVEATPALAGGVLDLRAGQEIALPCETEAVARAAAPVSLPLGVGEGLRILTGPGYAPFTDPDWPGQGMLTEIVAAAFDAGAAGLRYEITWESQWSEHLFPLVDEARYDMGFPWFRPACEAEPAEPLCANFHFSEPLVDLVILLFVRNDARIPFERDRDLVGRRLCRPAGYFTHDLDGPGRRWLEQGLVELAQPDTAEDCFDLLMAGRVDAVALNEFQGVKVMHDMGLGGAVTPLRRPLSEQSMHMVISKTHWQGTTHMFRFDEGLRALKAQPAYNEIINRHLAHFWDKIEAR